MSLVSSFTRRGTPYIWWSASMAIVALFMLGLMLYLTLVNGLSHFWPRPVLSVTLSNGEKYFGMVVNQEVIDPTHNNADEHAVRHGRSNYKIGARDVYGLDFKWIDDSAVAMSASPTQLVAMERQEHGDLYGMLVSAATEAGELSVDADRLYDTVGTLSKLAGADAARIRYCEKRISQLYAPVNAEERLLASARTPERLRQPGGREKLETLERAVDSMRQTISLQTAALESEISSLRALNDQRIVRVELAEGQPVTVRLADVARMWRPNAMTFGQKVAHYISGLWTFLSEDPREANTGGGIWPAIFGTVLMVFLMALGVAPFGVIAALYLHEYAKDNAFVRIVRLAVNNLAGVPSIVFGVFGLGFFVYFIGGGIDRMFYSEYLPSPTFGSGGILWASLTLALLTVPVVIVATEEGLAAVPRELRNGSLALGATKFQTIRKIVIPYSVPGILTGLILAVARGAGEVAPLMLTGVVPLVSDAPLDGTFPFLHLERKFMHLGFHIYDVGFQSPNVEAVKPLVYSTTLVLIVLVVALNLTAIIMRNHLRKKFRGSAV